MTTVTIKPRVAHVTIYQGDDLPRLAELRNVRDVARRRALDTRGRPMRVGDEFPSAEEAEKDYQEFLVEAAGRAVEVELWALRRGTFRDLRLAHPPRLVTNPDGEEVEHEDDRVVGVNVETYPQALLTYDDGKRRTIQAPEFGTAEAREEWLEDLSEGDYDKLWQSAHWLNASEGVDPKDLLS